MATTHPTSDVIPLSLANEWANRMTYDRLRVEAMGWKFIEIKVSECDPPFERRITGTFRCVCGRDEYFAITIWPETRNPEAYDVVRVLADSYSFSREHLLGDGYTEAQIAEFMKRGEEFDRLTREHWMPIILREWSRSNSEMLVYAPLRP